MSFEISEETGKQIVKIINACEKCKVKRLSIHGLEVLFDQTDKQGENNNIRPKVLNENLPVQVVDEVESTPDRSSYLDALMFTDAAKFEEEVFTGQVEEAYNSGVESAL